MRVSKSSSPFIIFDITNRSCARILGAQFSPQMSLWKQICWKKLQVYRPGGTPWLKNNDQRWQCSFSEVASTISSLSKIHWDPQLYLIKGSSVSKYSQCKCLRMCTCMQLLIFRHMKCFSVFLFCMSHEHRVKLCKTLPCWCADARCVGLVAQPKKTSDNQRWCGVWSFRLSSPSCCCFRAPTALTRYTVELMGQFRVDVKEISSYIEHLHSTLKVRDSNSETERHL